MQGDTFINNSKNNSTSKHNPLDENNFFVQPEITQTKSIPQVQKHINDYDFNILKEDAYKDISNDILKLEYQISKTEETLKDINQQIQAAKDIRDFELAETLFQEYKELNDNLKTLTAMYNNASLSAKISGSIAAKIKECFNTAKNNMYSAAENLLSKLPGKFSSIVEIKNSLSKLENINKSVDELIGMQIPYGEANYRYDILSKYISKANTIQAQISRYIK